jgi:hypothetical protein
MKRANEQIKATRDFYLNSINFIPDNENKLIAENIELKSENNKFLIYQNQIGNLEKSWWRLWQM